MRNEVFTYPPMLLYFLSAEILAANLVS